MKIAENKIAEYVSLETMSAMANLPQAFIKTLAKNNDLPALCVNGRLRFNPQAVQTALDKLAEQEGGNNAT